ncbi:DUF6221 family protein [Streptomyces sp. NBC_00523]|nr:DUF6221 family protein [Streptomyces sp. NBC_00523]WUC98388.1 DUF6221 family protein [Streptomyces sp. NBC_00523]
MSQGLVTFLHARLDEEADLARRCDGDGCAEWTAHGHTVDFSRGVLSGFHPTIALHVAAYDPARALREVEAKRRVLSRHVLGPATGDPELPWDNRDDCQYGGETWPCDDLLDLASPYADHSDYPRQPRDRDRLRDSAALSRCSRGSQQPSGTASNPGNTRPAPQHHRHGTQPPASRSAPTSNPYGLSIEPEPVPTAPREADCGEGPGTPSE